MSDPVEQLKATKRAKSAIIKNRMEKTIQQLEKLQSEHKIVYFNGRSEEIKQECISAKERIKTKEFNFV